MSDERAPQPGHVYRVNGQPALYVRTEARYGSEVPEHLFVFSRDRIVLTRWTPEVPDEFELIIDTEGRRQADEARWLLWAADHDRGILLGLLKQACAWLPRERADELRQRWKLAQPPPMEARAAP